MSYDIFISYSTIDLSVVSYLSQYIKFPNVTIFIAEYQIQPGQNLWETIKKSIDNCQVFIVFISNNSLKSQEVMTEIGYAVKAQKMIIPIIIEHGVKPPSMIAGLKYVNFTLDQAKAISELQSVIHSHKTAKENADTLIKLGLVLFGLWALNTNK